HGHRESPHTSVGGRVLDRESTRRRLSIGPTSVPRIAFARRRSAEGRGSAIEKGDARAPVRQRGHGATETRGDPTCHWQYRPHSQEECDGIEDRQYGLVVIRAVIEAGNPGLVWRRQVRRRDKRDERSKQRQGNEANENRRAGQRGAARTDPRFNHRSPAGMSRPRPPRILQGSGDLQSLTESRPAASVRAYETTSTL